MFVIVRPVNCVKTFLVREIVTSLIGGGFLIITFVVAVLFHLVKQSLSMAQIEEASSALRCSLVFLVFIAEDDWAAAFEGKAAPAVTR